MKKIVSLLLTVILLTSLCGVACAQDAPPADQIAPSGYSFVEWYNPLRSDEEFYMTYASASIDGGTGSVTFSASTEANMAIDSVGGDVYIQRWKNNKWNNYYDLRFVGLDRDSFSITRTISVDSGYYYRLVVYHECLYSGQLDLAESTTKSVYVN